MRAWQGVKVVSDKMVSDNTAARKIVLCFGKSNLK